MLSFRTKRSGAALVMFTVMLVLVVLPMVGLAIDGSILFLIRARLTTAADAAALAGARSLSVGLDIDSQISSAQTTAQNYFTANFPAGVLGTTNPVFSAAVTQTATKTRTVGVQATVTAPLYFMHLLGHSTSPVTIQSQASRRDVNMILVLDRSQSMAAAGVCGTMIASAQNFVSRFTNGRDRLGLISFTGSSSIDFAPDVNFMSDSPNLPTVIGNLQCGGTTGSAEALWLAYQQILAVNEPGALNLIVFFTDGVPNGVNASYPKKTNADTRYDSYNFGTLVTTPASGCIGTGPFPGVIAAVDFDPVGYTIGVMNPVASSDSDTSLQSIYAPGCAFNSDILRSRQDIAYMPPADVYGNLTTGYVPSDLYTSGAYAGQLRVDTPYAVLHASTNAADNAASRIRADSTFAPVIYCIGLGGTTAYGPVDPVFLNRVANTPQSTAYDNTKLSGIYAFAPNASELSSAFETVASQILRLSQ